MKKLQTLKVFWVYSRDQVLQVTAYLAYRQG